MSKGMMMRTGTVVDATLISAPSSTKNSEGERDPEMKQSRKAANVNDLNVAGELLHGDEEAAFGDAGYQGVHKRPEAEGPIWNVAMRPGKRKKLNPFVEPEFVAERVDRQCSRWLL